MLLKVVFKASLFSFFSYVHVFSAGCDPEQHLNYLTLQGSSASYFPPEYVDDKRFQTKYDGHFILGSNRVIGTPSEGMWGKIYGTKDDGSHLSTFDGAATTMDEHILPSPYSNGVKHIVGDARTFDFRDYNVMRVLCERLPTFDAQKCSLDPRFLKENYTGACIEQISQAMLSGATLDIEWDPYVVLWDEDESETTRYIGSNPFNGFLNMNLVSQSIYALYQQKEVLFEQNPELFRMNAKIRKAIQFYANKGVSPYEHLLAKIHTELTMVEHMTNNEVMVHIGCDLKKATIGEFMPAAALSDYGTFLGLDSRNLISQKVGGFQKTGFVYSAQTFVQFSLLNVVLGNVATESNEPYVRVYLERIGFKDVEFARKTNIYNGRENTMMIHAVKT